MADSTGLAQTLSLDGKLKIAQLVAGALGFLFIIFGHPSLSGDIFLFISLVAFISTVILFLIFAWDIVSVVTADWTKIQFYICAGIAIPYLSFSCVLIYVAHHLYIAGGLCGIITTILYAIDAYFKYSSLNSLF